MDTKVYGIEFVTDIPKKFTNDKLYLKRFAIDTVGTTSGAAWVYVFGKNRYGDVALYKPIDYDEPLGAYAELLYSCIAKLCFYDTKIRIPDINLVSYNNELGILSYSVLSNLVEDLIHIESIMSYKYTEKQLFYFYTLGINDILECIKIEVSNEKNYKEIEKAVVETVILDSLTNNCDRHSKNWGLVRTKNTNYYELATFDNVKSFINILFNRVGYTETELWVIQYIGKNSSSKLCSGNDTANYIQQAFPNYFYDFLEKFKTSYFEFIFHIEALKELDLKRISTFLRKKGKYFNPLDEFNY